MRLPNENLPPWRWLAALLPITAVFFYAPLAFGGTPSYRQVWEALRGIPSGTTRSHAELAKTIGRPTAMRAVARANGANPLALLVPCHRMIGTDGSLTGYGGGLWRKQRLLEIPEGGDRAVILHAELIRLGVIQYIKPEAGDD